MENWIENHHLRAHRTHSDYLIRSNYLHNTSSCLLFGRTDAFSIFFVWFIFNVFFSSSHFVLCVCARALVRCSSKCECKCVVRPECLWGAYIGQKACHSYEHSGLIRLIRDVNMHRHVIDLISFRVECTRVYHAESTPWRTHKHTHTHSYLNSQRFQAHWCLSVFAISANKQQITTATADFSSSVAIWLPQTIRSKW